MARTAWRLPFRKKRNGKEGGAFYTRGPDRRDLNLRTQNADEALKRLAKAKKGQRVFEDDNGGAARAVAESLGGTGGAPTPPVVEPAAPAASGLPPAGPPAPPPTLPPTYTAPPALPPIGAQPQPESPPGAPPAPEPAHPDGYRPPPPGWADAVADAAGTEGPRPGAAPDSEFQNLKITDADLDEILDGAADWAVDIQLKLQAELAARGYLVPKIKVRVADVPPDAKVRAIGKKVWKIAFKKLIAKYFPDLDLPEWIVAPVLVLSFSMPIQLGPGASVIKPGEKPATPEGAPSATP